jgi:hypothetical protein
MRAIDLDPSAPPAGGAAVRVSRSRMFRISWPRPCGCMKPPTTPRHPKKPLVASLLSSRLSTFVIPSMSETADLASPVRSATKPATDPDTPAAPAVFWLIGWFLLRPLGQDVIGAFLLAVGEVSQRFNRLEGSTEFLRIQHRPPDNYPRQRPNSDRHRPRLPLDRRVEDKEVRGVSSGVS